MSGVHGFSVSHVEPMIDVQCPVCGKYTEGDNIRIRIEARIVYLHRQCANALKDGIDRVVSGKNSRWTNED